MQPKRLLAFTFLGLAVAFVFVNGARAEDSAPESASSPKVTFETSLGSFTLALYPDEAPKTVANFLAYVDEGFYDGTLFHRVIPRFVVQGGGFEAGMERKRPGAPVVNESDNGLKNTRGTISMARTRDPDSATSQFFINLRHNPSLDFQGGRPGYTVFGEVTEGMEVIEKIVQMPTTTVGPYSDVPEEDVVVVSARRADGSAAPEAGAANFVEPFVAGEHYVVLDEPIPTRDAGKIEVVALFAYGCPHCYEFDPLVRGWSQEQADDLDFRVLPAVWNKAMKPYARAYYAAQALDVSEIVHESLFTAIVIEQRQLDDEEALAAFFGSYGVDEQEFHDAMESEEVAERVQQAEERVRAYNPVGVPEVVINGRYRVDRMRAGGLAQMLPVVEFLVAKERTRLRQLSAR
jgi:cyclophilin family peptidyl-prolyl cis-trans isomerase